MKIIIPLFGVATLLWNGHIFSVGGSPFAVACAVVTTAVWIGMFVQAYARAYP